MKFAKAMTALSCALALISCDGKQGPQKWGSVSVALTSTGSDGSTYRLPAGSSLELDNTSADGTFNVSVGLDGNAPEIDVSAAPGNYNATLIDPAGDSPTPAAWTLEKVNSDGTVIGTVSATLVTAMPVALTVVASETTPLVFAFRIPTGGIITFQRGNIGVTVTVTTEPAASYSTDFNANLTTTTRTFGPFATQLTPVLPANGTAVSLDIGGDVSGGWVEAGGAENDPTTQMTVCAPLTITTRSITGGTQGEADFLAETNGPDSLSLFGGGTSLCVYDDGTVNSVRIRVSHLGTPITPTFQAIIENEIWTRFVLWGQLADRPYDSSNGTLDLGMLMADTASGLTIVSAAGIMDDGTGDQIGQAYVQQSFGGGGINFSFTGH